MKIIATLFAVLVRGNHVAANTALTVGKDIDVDDAATLVRHGIAKDVTEELPEGAEPVDLASLKIDELKAIAAEKDIDLGDAKTKAAILELVEKALAAEAAGA